MAKQNRTSADMARDTQDFVLTLNDKLDWISAIVTSIEVAAKSDDPLLGQQHIALLAGAARYLSEDASAEASTFVEQVGEVQA